MNTSIQCCRDDCTVHILGYPIHESDQFHNDFVCPRLEVVILGTLSDQRHREGFGILLNDLPM